MLLVHWILLDLDGITPFSCLTSLKESYVRTFDFLLRQAEQARDAFFFNRDKSSIGVGSSDEFNDGAGAKRGDRNRQAIKLHQQQTHNVGTLQARQLMIAQSGSVDLNKGDVE